VFPEGIVIVNELNVVCGDNALAKEILPLAFVVVVLVSEPVAHHQGDWISSEMW
jgi:hypothetical protein